MSTTGAAPSPAEALATPVDGVNVLGSLSPSRANDFMTCPLLYRFRVIDRLPEPLSPAAVRGTLVHRVLELLFDEPAAARTPETAQALVEPTWAELLERDEELAGLFPDGDGADGANGANGADGSEAADERARWLDTVRAAVDRYFTLEDPTRLEPAERESYVEAVLDSKLLLRGFIDRLDIAPDGRIRVVDFKTGRAPGPGFEAKAFFQLKVYALVLWRTRGVVPAMLQLLYLGSGDVLRYEPDEADLLATERKVEAVWRAIRAAEESGDWQPRPGRLCDWCAHRSICPSFGGTPPGSPVMPRSGPR